MASPIVFTSYEQVLLAYFPKRTISLFKSESQEVPFEPTLAKDVIDHLKKELLAPAKKKSKPVKTAPKRKR